MGAPARESLKTGMIFAAVGVALALVVPSLLASAAAMTGLAAGSFLGAAGVVGSALVFGGFGVLYPSVKSFVGSAFGNQQPDAASQSAASRVSGDSRHADVDSLPAPGQDLQNVSGEHTTTTFCQKLDADRAQKRSADSLGI